MTTQQVSDCLHHPNGCDAEGSEKQIVDRNHSKDENSEECDFSQLQSTSELPSFLGDTFDQALAASEVEMAAQLMHAAAEEAEEGSPQSIAAEAERVPSDCWMP